MSKSTDLFDLIMHHLSNVNLTEQPYRNQQILDWIMVDLLNADIVAWIPGDQTSYTLRRDFSPVEGTEFERRMILYQFGLDVLGVDMYE